MMAGFLLILTWLFRERHEFARAHPDPVDARRTSTRCC